MTERSLVRAEGWDYRGHGDARFRYFCRINCDQADAAGFVQLGTDCTLKITLKSVYRRLSRYSLHLYLSQTVNRRNEVMDTIPEGVVLARRFLDERAKTYFKSMLYVARYLSAVILYSCSIPVPSRCVCLVPFPSTPRQIALSSFPSANFEPDRKLPFWIS